MANSLRSLLLIAAVISAPGCAGSAAPVTSVFDSVRAAFQMISPNDDAADLILFDATLTTALINVVVAHWDATVPAKVPPFLETDIGAHGAATVTMDATDLGMLDANFPVGDGVNGFGALATMPAPAAAGTYHIFHLEVAGDIPVVVGDPTLLFEYSFVFDSDNVAGGNYTESGENYHTGTDRWYQLTYSNAQGWRLTVSTATSTDPMTHIVTEVMSAARVIITGNAVLLVVPTSEFAVGNPPYRTSTFLHDGDFGIPGPPHSWSGNAEPRIIEGLQPYPVQP